MKKTFKFLAASIIILGLASCEKETDGLDAFDDVINSEMEQGDVQLEEELGAQECTAHDFSAHLPAGVVVTNNDASFPKTITIDYGSGIEDDKGRVKAGKVIITLTGEMVDAGSKKTITFEDFSVNDVSIEGIREVVNNGENSNGNIEFTVTGEMTGTRDGKSRTRSFTRTREWIAGYETCDRADDEFMITGSATVVAGPRTIKREIISPIHIAPGTCKFPLSGSISVERGNGKGGTIDFGDGTCDSEAILTLNNGDVKEIDLENRKCKK